MSLAHATDMLNAISHLHNFTINQCPDMIHNVPIIQTNNPQLGYQPSTPADSDEQEVIQISLRMIAPVCNVSMIRATLVRKIRQNGLARPGC